MGQPYFAIAYSALYTSALGMSATTKRPKSNEPSTRNAMPSVEQRPNEIESPVLSPALERRIRQQELLAELGVSALQGASFSQLLDATVRLTAEGMQAEFGKVLEHIPTEGCLLVRAGVDQKTSFSRNVLENLAKIGLNALGRQAHGSVQQLTETR